MVIGDRAGARADFFMPKSFRSIEDQDGVGLVGAVWCGRDRSECSLEIGVNIDGSLPPVGELIVRRVPRWL